MTVFQGGGRLLRGKISLDEVSMGLITFLIKREGDTKVLSARVLRRGHVKTE